jgi:hypothetical protein
MKKIKDLVCKVRAYTDRDGKAKNVWQNVGAVMQDDNGGEFITISRFINFAGFPNPDNRDTIIVSAFDVKDGNQSAPPPAARSSAPDDDIPF